MVGNLRHNIVIEKHKIKTMMTTSKQAKPTSKQIKKTGLTFAKKKYKTLWSYLNISLI